MVEKIQRLLGKIPGYDAYSTKESMRDDDRRLREQIADRLNQSVADLTSVSSALASKRQLGAISVVEDLVRDTRMLSDRVRTASYGYSGLFSDRSIDEYALAQLKAFDVAFDTQVEALAAGIAEIGASGEMAESRIRDVSTQLDTLDRLFSARGNVITTATPTTDPNVLSLLDSPVTLSEREQNLLRLRVGGAIAILGDNFQIGAHIIVKDRNGDVSLSLLRLDEGPSWLAVVKQEGVQCWKVTESTSGPPLGSPATEGRATVSGPQGTKSDVPATYDVQATGSGVSSTVIIHLVVGSDIQVYSGSSVPLIDIEVFGEGNSA